VKAYVINLVRSPERRAHMQRELHKTGMEYEFIEAVDGTECDLEDSSISSPISLGRGLIQQGAWRGARYWPGVLGCALSHLKVYRKILEDGAEVALVLEDDIILPADIHELAEAVAAHMTTAEVALLQYHNLGANHGRALRLSRMTATQLPRSRVLAFPAEIADVACSGAYVVTREACELMARLVLPVRVPADDWSFYVANYGLHGLRCVAPMPVGVDPTFHTTIPWSLKRLALPLLGHALARRRQAVMTETELVDRRSDQRYEQELVDRGPIDVTKSLLKFA